MRTTALALLAFMLLAPARAQELETLRYTPPSKSFSCDLPGAGWYAFEEEEGWGFATHILGPDNPNSTYRAGIDIRYVEKGQPGWEPLKKRIDERLRRGDSLTDRNSTVPRAYRIPAGLSRVFEVIERRRLPGDQLPSVDEELHYYYAMVPQGESYFEIKMATTRDDYFPYREAFAKFLRNFRPIGVGR